MTPKQNEELKRNARQRESEQRMKAEMQSHQNRINLQNLKSGARPHQDRPMPSKGGKHAPPKAPGATPVRRPGGDIRTMAVGENGGGGSKVGPIKKEPGAEGLYKKHAKKVDRFERRAERTQRREARAQRREDRAARREARGTSHKFDAKQKAQEFKDKKVNKILGKGK